MAVILANNTMLVSRRLLSPLLRYQLNLVLNMNPNENPSLICDPISHWFTRSLILWTGSI